MALVGPEDVGRSGADPGNVSPPKITPLMTFDEATRVAVDYLATAVPMACWSLRRLGESPHDVVRIERESKDDPQAAPANPVEIHAPEGDDAILVPYSGEARRFVSPRPDADVEIRSCAIVPVLEPGGEPFGLLCGHDSEEKPRDFEEHAPLLELIALLLGMVLTADRERDKASRRATAAYLEAEIDALTLVHNRPAWGRLLAEEEKRFAKYGDPTVLLTAEVEGLEEINAAEGHRAGDRQLALLGSALRDARLSGDGVARVADNEFVMLLTRCTSEVAQLRVADLEAALAAAGATASVGWASARADGGLEGARAAAAIARRSGSDEADSSFREPAGLSSTHR